MALLLLTGSCLLLPPEAKLQNPFDGPLPFFATLVENLSAQFSSASNSNTIEVSGVIDTVAEGQAFNIGVRLSRAPASNATVTVSSNSSSLTLNGGSTFTVTFTASNYDSEQAITVVPMTDNNNISESVTLSFQADGFSDVTQVITVSDDLIPVITDTPSSIEEGKSSVISVKLSKEIDSTKEVTITSNNSAITVNDAYRSVLTFTKDNWDAEQSVTLTAVSDSNTDSETATLSFVLNGATTVNYSVTNLEPSTGVNNTFSVIAPRDIVEGTEATAQITLSIKAETTQTVSITSDHPSIEISPNSLTFTPGNSTVTQTFQLTSLLDNNTDSEVVNITIASSDVETATLNIIHRETTGDWLVVSGSTLLEEGIDSTLAVKLAFKPHEDIPVNINFSDTSIVSASPATLTFTSANYDTIQNVTIEPIQDNNIVAEKLSLEVAAIGFQSKNSTTIKYDDEALGGMAIGLLKTGQTTEIVSGDDGTHQSGLDRNYTDMGDGTILDNTTGLTWQKCTMGQDNNSECTGAGVETNWLIAETSCSSLSLAGKDWRLPNIIEFATIIDTSQANPTIDPTYFPKTPAYASYWGSEDAESPADAWYIYFYQGYIGESFKYSNRYVRCVSGPALTNHNFTDNGDGTITDNITNLIWQKCSKGESNDSLCSGNPDPNNEWEDAVSYCNTLNFASKNWRLPTRNELLSIFDYSRYDATIDTTFFPYTLTESSDIYWSSTSLTSDSTEPMIVHTMSNSSYSVSVKSGTSHLLPRGVDLDPLYYFGHYVRCVSDP